MPGKPAPERCPAIDEPHLARVSGGTCDDPEHNILAMHSIPVTVTDKIGTVTRTTFGAMLRDNADDETILAELREWEHPGMFADSLILVGYVGDWVTVELTPEGVA